MGEDELGVVLRAHFYIEGAVEALIEELLPFPKHLPKLRFEQKAKLACALGLDGSVLSPLEEFGHLRNTFGHQIGAKLTQGSVRKFFEAFSPADRKTIETGYKLTQQQLGDLPKMKDLCPKDLFVVTIIALYKILAQSHSEVKGKPLR